jgi:hypothetical protein
MSVNASDIKALARDLKVLGDGHMAKDLYRELRQAGLPIVDDIKAAVLAIPSKSDSATTDARSRRAMARYGKSKARNKTIAKFDRKAGLRETIARAVKQSVSASGGTITIKVDADMLPNNQRMLPWDLEGVSRWRHPVYGHDVWVTQPSHPFFFATVDRDLPVFDVAVNKVIDEAAAAAGF